ncbi:MAG: OmpA family protein [Bacteroidota bacterium]
MRKIYLNLFILCYALPFYAQSGNWYVQVGVFETQVDINYFNKIGSQVYHSHDTYGFHRYYKGVYDEAEAKNRMTQFGQMGYNCALVSKDELGNSCVCNYIPMPQNLLNSIKNIFFDFDRSNLRTESRKQLSDLVTILRDFPDYSTTLRAHTDSKGSNSYNESLSLRRANAAKQYLISRGISSSRIKTETFGEADPIAKNELNDGQDTEEGRQFNRRVEILITDKYGGILNEIVDEIEIPDELINTNG